MARRTVTWMAAAFLAVLIVPVAPAAAGGGCHQGVTQGNGDTVEMVDACFTPTILTVDPGETVTFVNTDPLAHNVDGEPVGPLRGPERGRRVHGDVRRAGYLPVRVRLPPGDDRPIVVGSGTGARERGHRVDVDPLVQPEASPVVEVRTVTQARAAPRSRSGGSWARRSASRSGWASGAACSTKRDAGPSVPCHP